MLGHIDDLAHNLDFERSIFSGPRRASHSRWVAEEFAAWRRALPARRAIIFVLRSRKLLLLVLRLRSVLRTLVGMVMRMPA